ncbi:MAG: penicillin-binding protein 2 [Candidatus Aminicenantia bacterium]
MEEIRIYEDLSPLLRRAKISFGMVGVLLLILLILFWKIQILDHNQYLIRSEQNRIREVTVPASRGLIKDRNGIILAENRASFNASIIRENCQNFNESLVRISKILSLDKKILKERINQYKFYPIFKPIILKENLSMKEVASIEARKLQLPELIIQVEPKRYYPFGSLAAHVIGYVQEVSREELRKSEYHHLKMGDIIGKSGVERKYDFKLRGKNGKIKKVVNSHGRFVEDISHQRSIPGQDLILTLDYDLQKKVEQLLGGREGAIVVLNPTSGEILALASSPTYDPNKFVRRFNQKEWKKLINDPKSPLENRALRGLYAPGSVFKLTIALAALEKGLINPNSSFFCSGAANFYGRIFSCWDQSGHGWVNLYNGIKHSCNIYFYNLGKLLGIKEIENWAYQLGLGCPTRIDLPGEKEGLVPSPEWKMKNRQTPWFSGETITLSIGQGALLVTPLQIAIQTAIIANRGIKVIPHLLKSWSESKEDNNEERYIKEKVNINKESFERVISGMWGVVNDQGTGRAARIKGYDVCGKTGSTQVISKRKDSKNTREVTTHSWFIGFAPRDKPQIVVTVIVEYGGMGGETAAPLARKIFELYRKKNDSSEAN